MLKCYADTHWDAVAAPIDCDAATAVVVVAAAWPALCRRARHDSKGESEAVKAERHSPPRSEAVQAVHADFT